MELIERIKNDYREKLQAGPKIITVPEWGESKKKPLKIYVWPANLKVRDKINRYVQAGSPESLVEALVLRAMDEDRKPLFRPGDKSELMRMADPDLIARIVREMNAVPDDEASSPVSAVDRDEPTIEDAEKN